MLWADFCSVFQRILLHHIAFIDNRMTSTLHRYVGRITQTVCYCYKIRKGVIVTKDFILYIMYLLVCLCVLVSSKLTHMLMLMISYDLIFVLELN